ncbi:pre-mRNA-processing protein, putative [Candida dubliniensis CD36]|uniref:Pre-mRNA-processing protein 45 n=1 Tax=Candida dubliniensis (strain CD36 / ATCC MYA-646 / CBS 7987 / NCPF 3949 / NRRL Y-17841) TaxID=573826 RepID=B9WIV4_CANDC|nr:pre-mRNA-processing protein, putative [Candida dubliniensis CD36]CAX41172.1 pre-mRNA-processing protein, putative [Candida dubliniensis CD36]
MFSSLLSRPINSSYDPSYHFFPVARDSKNDSTVKEVVSTTKKEITTPSLKYDTTIPLKKRYPNLVHNFPKPELDENLILETKKMIDSIIHSSSDEPTNDINYIKYETLNSNSNSKSNSNQNQSKIIQIKQFQEDPMLPPRFKLRKNRHERIIEDITFVKDPKTKKLTKEDREFWNIPAAISNWKNSQGFTIGLDKRMIGREYVSPEMNITKFNDLSTALSDADLQAREDLKKRNEIRQQKQLQEKRLRDERIKEIASRSKRRKRY